LNAPGGLWRVYALTGLEGICTSRRIVVPDAAFKDIQLAEGAA